MRAPEEAVKARQKILPYPVRQGGWPHPTFSEESAFAFMEKSRPDDRELTELVEAFRRLPPRTLRSRELRDGFLAAAKTLQFLFNAWRTEARFRAPFIRHAIPPLLEILRWCVQEETSLAEAQVKVRTKLDRREPLLSTTVSVLMAARRMKVRDPSDSELAAMAVLHRDQPPTKDDVPRKSYWRTMRRRALRQLPSVEPLSGDIQKRSIRALYEDALRRLRQPDAPVDDAFGSLLREAEAIVEADAGGTDPPR